MPAAWHVALLQGLHMGGFVWQELVPSYKQDHCGAAGFGFTPAAIARLQLQVGKLHLAVDSLEQTLDSFDPTDRLNEHASRLERVEQAVGSGMEPLRAQVAEQGEALHAAAQAAAAAAAQAAGASAAAVSLQEAVAAQPGQWAAAIEAAATPLQQQLGVLEANQAEGARSLQVRHRGGGVAVFGSCCAEGAISEGAVFIIPGAVGHVAAWPIKHPIPRHSSRTDPACDMVLAGGHHGFECQGGGRGGRPRLP